MGGTEEGQGCTLKAAMCELVAIVGLVLPLLACQKSLPTAELQPPLPWVRLACRSNAILG